MLRESLDDGKTTRVMYILHSVLSFFVEEKILIFFSRQFYDVLHKVPKSGGTSGGVGGFSF